MSEGIPMPTSDNVREGLLYRCGLQTYQRVKRTAWVLAIAGAVIMLVLEIANVTRLLPVTANIGKERQVLAVWRPGQRVFARRLRAVAHGNAFRLGVGGFKILHINRRAAG